MPYSSKEKSAAKAREWYTNNPERYKKTHKAWYERNKQDPDWVLERNTKHKARPRYSDPTVKRKDWELRIKRQFNLEPEDVARMFEAQKGFCAVSFCCTRLLFDKCTHIDHDHETGRVRGLLCESCNLCLGRLLESSARLRGLAAYIERFK